MRSDGLIPRPVFSQSFSHCLALTTDKGVHASRYHALSCSRSQFPSAQITQSSEGRWQWILKATWSPALNSWARKFQATIFKTAGA